MMTERRTLSGWFHLHWPSWFSARGQRAAARRKAEDFADHGTAFGLDMSMDHQSLSATRPAADTPPADAPAPRR